MTKVHKTRYGPNPGIKILKIVSFSNTVENLLRILRCICLQEWSLGSLEMMKRGPGSRADYFFFSSCWLRKEAKLISEQLHPWESCFSIGNFAKKETANAWSKLMKAEMPISNSSSVSVSGQTPWKKIFVHLGRPLLFCSKTSLSFPWDQAFSNRESLCQFAKHWPTRKQLSEIDFRACQDFDKIVIHE